MSTTQTATNEIKLSRFFDAPVPVVWDAWTDPKQAAQWWGPRGFTLTSHSREVKTGGHWHYTMHGPNGADYVNKTQYLEVKKHEKMVYDHGGNDERKPLFRVTVTFKSINGGTQMDMTMACPSVEDAVQTRGFIKKAGGDATWDRLTEYLIKQASGKEAFVINRSFDAPVGVIQDIWPKFEKPETLRTTVKVLFTEETPARTRVTVTCEPDGQASPEEIAAFVQARAGMTKSWTGSFDKLENLLQAKVS